VEDFMRTLSKTAVVASAALLAAVVAQASDVKEVHRTLPLDREGRLTVKTFKGSVTVTTWDRPEVKIDARIEPDGDDRESREKVQWTEVRISGGGSGVEVESDYDKVRHHEHGFLGLFNFENSSLPFVRYTIQMPAGARLDIDDYKSETRISDLKADLKLHTYKGSVRVANLDGAARVDTYKGDIQVSFARFSRASRFETHKGEIDLRLPKDSRFELDAEAGRRGEIESDFLMMAKAGHSRGARAAGAVNGGGPELRLTTYKGTLRIRSS
jgi:Putative adhesin